MGFKKNFQPKKLKKQAQDIEEKKFDDLFDDASNGDTRAIIEVLEKSGRGYNLSEADLEEILQHRKESF